MMDNENDKQPLITVDSILNEEDHYDVQYSIYYPPTPTYTFPQISLKDILKANSKDEEEEEEDEQLNQIIEDTQKLVDINIQPHHKRINYEMYEQFSHYINSLRYPPLHKHTHVLDSLSAKEHYPFIQVTYVEEIINKMNPKIQPTCIAVCVTVGKQ